MVKGGFSLWCVSCPAADYWSKVWEVWRGKRQLLPLRPRLHFQRGRNQRRQEDWQVLRRQPPSVGDPRIEISFFLAKTRTLWVSLNPLWDSCRPVFSEGNQLLIQFLSDLSLTADGFIGHYKFRPKKFPTTTLPPTTTTQPVTTRPIRR